MTEQDKTEESWEERFDKEFPLGFFSLRTPSEIRKKFKVFISQTRQEAVQSKLDEVEREVEIELCGINKTETEDENGWWETSTGADFGERKLKAILAIISKHKK